MAPLASQLSFNEGLMRLCAIHGKTVAFSYSKEDSKVIEPRRLNPSEVYTTKDGSVGFRGFDPDRGAIRNYRINRVLGEVKID